MEINEARKKKHGPDPLPPEEKRTHCVSSWMNKAEVAQLDSQRGKLGKGEYLRCAALDKLPPTIPAINQQAWVELARVAANLNQLAKACNIDTSGKSWEEIMQTLKELRAALIGAKL
jgi:hypothetical protein